MGSKSFLIAGDHAALVANDVTDFRYRAARHTLGVGVQIAAQVNDRAETQFMVEDGLVEIMIGGATGHVLPGDFARVPPGVAYAYRNAGETVAHLLIRSASPTPARRALRLGFDFAA